MSQIYEMLNEQVNKEFYSSYLYLYFANFYMNKGLNGFANWYKIQSQEENDHAMLFIQYMQNNDIKVTLEAIQKPDIKLNENIDALKASLEHEKYITESIHNIYDQALIKKDFRTIQFLDWFIKEQGEEESTANELVTKMELFGLDSKGLYMLDQEMASRTYSAPSLIL